MSIRASQSILLTGLFLLSSALPVLAFDVQESGPPVMKVPTFYVTDRAEITSNKVEAGAQLSNLKMGCASVFLPAKELTQALSKLGCTIDQERSTQEPYIEVRGYVAEPEPEKCLKLEESNDFWQKLSDASKVSKSIFVYIHGFASSGDNAVYSAGILQSHVEAPVISFTWPSKGTAGLKYIRFWGRKRIRALYKDDREMIDSPKVMSDLKTFLKDLKGNMPVDTQINLVAHSLGNRLMARYLASDAVEKFDRVYFIAPDVDNDLFVQVARSLRKKARYVAVFHNPKDRVLKLSAANDLLSLKNTDKLGTGGADLTGIEFVDYGKIAQPRSLEYLRVLHYVPFEHFANIIHNGYSSVSDKDDSCFIVHRSAIETRKKAKVKEKAKTASTF